MKTYSAKPGEVEQKWYLIDAADKPLGRLASEISRRLRGKHKPQFTPHVDTGDHIVVINAARVAVTGNKKEQKIYYRHSGYVGNLKQTSLKKMLEQRPERAIEYAVRGMLPKNRLGRAMFRKLRVYADGRHKHEAQQPTRLEILN